MKVEPDSIEGLVAGIKNSDRIDRYSCRAVVEQKYSLEALGNRAINWFEEIFCSQSKINRLSWFSPVKPNLT